jgi:hypothetical protein
VLSASKGLRKSPAGIPKLPSNSFGFFWSKKQLEYFCAKN